MKLYDNKYPISDNAEYVVDYIYDNPSGANFYFQLVRLKERYTLRSQKPNRYNTTLLVVGIPKEKVAFI